MHFFIDHTKLIEQNIADSFGVNSSNSNLFKITSEFQLAAQAKTFACQDGMMIVQQSNSDSSLVNIILKPTKGLNIQFSSVKYYLYRGVSKDSLFINDQIIPKSQVSENSFLQRVWMDIEEFRVNFNLPNYPDPVPKDFGYDETLSNTIEIEKLFDNSQSVTFPIYVKEGEWIGNFGSDKKIGFEIILETDNLENPSFNNQINLEYLRKQNHIINVSDLSAFEKRAKQELLLSYIDPCAFFGLHYDTGVDISVFSGSTKSIQNKKQDELYDQLLDKFKNKNKVYLDIRSENGYSYNFYQNYKDTNNKNVKIENNASEYESDSWPILILDSLNKSKINLNLRIDDNQKPILFSENRELFEKQNNSCFIDDTKLLNENATDWSKDITLNFPTVGTKNVVYYAKLCYFRQKNNVNFHKTVLDRNQHFDSFFCPINLSKIANNDDGFQHVIYSNNIFNKGVLPNIDIDFSYVAETGANWDTTRIIFYAKSVFKNERTGQFFNNPIINNSSGFNLDGNFNKTSFLSSRVSLNVSKIQEVVSANIYDEIKILDIAQNNSFTGEIEDLICFGITVDEFENLQNVTDFADFHHRYIYLGEISNSPFTDKNGKIFRKYEVRIQGLDNNGNRLVKSASNPVYAYTQNGLVFASKEFAKQQTDTVSSSYIRNYEEKVGYENREPASNKTYQDWFIEKDAGIKAKVDYFITALLQLNHDVDFYGNAKTLVENSAKEIWNQAVNTVQVNNNANPDDRPLYWARIKMQVALKSHPYFNGRINNKDLDVLIQIFEEKSRNYTDVNFSSAPAGTKKILITGFDPFLLNDKHPLYGNSFNIKQSNPSGCVALALHNTLTQNGLGHIQTMIVPVRYTDFDGSKNSTSGQGEGIIETYIKYWIDKVDMIITISQAGPDEYHIDKFATATRGGFVDNMNFERVPNSRSINIIGKSELEWIKTTLPNQFIQQPVILSNEYTDKYGVKHNVNNIGNDVPVSGEQMLSGPGGDYLSNEIFYRVAKLREDWINSKLPNVETKATGHFHIAKLQDGYAKDDFNILNTQVLLNIVRTAINQGATGI